MTNDKPKTPRKPKVKKTKEIEQEVKEVVEVPEETQEPEHMAEVVSFTYRLYLANKDKNVKEDNKIASTSFEEIARKNQEKKSKTEEERKKHNKNVLRSYRIK